MRTIVSLKKTSTLMVGKFAGLSLLAALAMIFVTPLMANPAMCGLPNVGATYEQVISGFNFNPATKTYAFTKANDGTPIMIGTWLAVKGADGKEVPVALEQPLRLSMNKVTYRSNAPAVPPPALKDTPPITQNAMLIAGIPSNDKGEQWTVPHSCTPDGMCNPASPLKAKFVSLIKGFTFQNGTYTFTYADPGFRVSLGSFVEVTLPDGTNVPASIVKFRGANLFTPDKNNPNTDTMAGYVYIQAGTSTNHSQKLTISITKDQASKPTLSTVTNGLFQPSASAPTGWG